MATRQRCLQKAVLTSIYTALMQVLRLNNLSDKKAFIKTLIDNGADLTKLKNIQGKTALDIILDRI